MNEVPDFLSLWGPSTAGISSIPPWKLDNLKDLSAGGICETGYGKKNRTSQTLQYISDLKHREKYSSFAGWGITVLPALMDILPAILYHDNRRTPFRDILRRTQIVAKEKTGSTSTDQLGFLLSLVPVYNGIRALKNFVWKGSVIDPSGHLIFKMSQYGMMLSIATAHGTKLDVTKPVLSYIAIMAVADAVMLANTVTNCHTLVEVVIGGGLGVVILLAAHLISKSTPLGQWTKKAMASVLDKIAAKPEVQPAH